MPYRNNIAPPDVPWTFNQVLMQKMAEADAVENIPYHIHEIRNIDPRPDRFALFNKDQCITSGLTKRQADQLFEYLQDMEDRLARLPRFDRCANTIYQNHFGELIRVRDLKFIFGKAK